MSTDALLPAQPEGSECGTCSSCGVPVWRVLSVEGSSVMLDVRPDTVAVDSSGDVEMILVGGEWRGNQLAQTECLFDIGRPRWHRHALSCRPRRKSRTGQVPVQRG